MILTLLWWSIPAFIIYLIWYRIARPHKKDPKVSPLTILFAIVLTIVVISFFTLIWEDITESLTHGVSIWKLPKPERTDLHLKLILYHTGFVIPAIVLALALYFKFCKKGLRYSAIVMPYLIGSVLMIDRF